MPTMMELGASPEAQQIEAIVAAMKNRPNVQAQMRQQALEQALAQAAQNVQPFPELGTPEFAALNLNPTPQSALTADRELRFEGMPPAPQQNPEQALMEMMQREQQDVIPAFQQKGYALREGAMPQGAAGIGLQSGGYLELPSEQRTGVSIHDLRNRAAEAQGSPGILGMLKDAIMGPPPSGLTPDQQSRVERFNAADAASKAQQAERQKLVTQRAQMKQMGRDARMQGPGTVELAMLQQALQGGGAKGMPNPMLARLDPKTFALLTEAATRQQAQQRLDNETRRIGQRDVESDRRFDVSMGLQRQEMANAERRHQEEMAAAEAKNPLNIFKQAEEGNATAQAAAGYTPDQKINYAKRTGKLNPEATAYLNDQYKLFEPSTAEKVLTYPGRALGNAFGFGDGTSLETQRKSEFIVKMTGEGWPVNLLNQFIAQTGRKNAGRSKSDGKTPRYIRGTPASGDMPPLSSAM